ncbi:MAG: hypothetical protein D6738_03375 [Acidobacteria bacterium]|nr:MAG: hypothetical protein D6738_03375 [Acidobacteriota bacterium]
MGGRTSGDRTATIVLGCLAAAGALVLVVALVVFGAMYYLIAPVKISPEETILRGDELAYLSVSARPDDTALVGLIHEAIAAGLGQAQEAGGLDPQWIASLQAMQIRQLLPVRSELAFFAEDLRGGPWGWVNRTSISTGARMYRLMADRLLAAAAADPQSGVTTREIDGHRVYRFESQAGATALLLEKNDVTFGPADVLEAWLRSRTDAADGGLPDSIRTMYELVDAGDAMAWGYTTLLPQVLGPLVRAVPPKPPLRPEDDLELLESMRFLCAAGELVDPDTIELRAAVKVASSERPSPTDAERIAGLLGRAITGFSPHLQPSLHVTEIEENLVRLEGTIDGLPAALGLGQTAEAPGG